MKMNSWIVGLSLVAVLAGSSATASAQILFQTNFSGSSPYGFASQHNISSSQTSVSQTTSNGWAGTQGARIMTRAGQDQYQTGWYFGPNHSFRDGDIVYVRFRIRFDDNFRWDGEGSMQNKMVDFGSGNGRVILHQEKPHSTTPCGLADSYYPNFGSLSIKIGITNICTPAVPITYGQWYHVQMAVQTGSNASFKLWVNNNNQSSPSSIKTGFSMTTADWNDSWDFGGFITDTPVRDQGWVVDDFQVALSYDPNWAQSSGGTTTPTPTPDPTPTPTPTPTPPPPSPTVPTAPGPTGLPWTATFSSGNFSEWNRGANSQGNLSIVSGGLNGLAARASLQAGTENPNTYAEHVIGDYYSLPSPKQKVEEMWMVMWSKFDSPYTWPNDSQKIWIFNLTDGASSARRYQIYMFVTQTGEYRIDLADWSGSGRFVPVIQNMNGSAVRVAFNTWTKLKVYTRLNSPGVNNGVVKVWINDVLKIDRSDLNIRANTSYGIGKILLSGYTNDATSTNGVQWWDSWTASLTDPEAASSTPSAPTNLRIVPQP